MTRITIEDTLGIKRAEITLTAGQVTEVVGANASGKSSIAVACQAVLGRTSNPLGLPAVRARTAYLHEGAEQGKVRAEFEDGSEVLWEPHHASISAPGGTSGSRSDVLGGVDFTSRGGAKERLEALHAALLPPLPQLLTQVREALARHLHEDDLAGVVDTLTKRGWDAAYTIFADRARESKRAWGLVTGRTYGTRVAADWRPDGWLADYDWLTPADADARVVDARDGLDALLRVNAVSEAEVKAAQAAAERIPSMEEALGELERDEERARAADSEAAAPLQRAMVDRDQAEARVDESKKRREALAISEHTACPHCQGMLTILPSGELAAFDEKDLEQEIADTDNDLRTRMRALRGLRATIEECRETKTAAARELAEITSTRQRFEGELTAARRAAEKTDAPVATSEMSIAVAEGEASVEKALAVVRLVTAQRDATAHHESVTRYTAVAQSLGPAGIRSRLLGKGMKAFGKGLEVLADTTGWPIVAVEETGTVTVSGRPAALCSESERWRAQACIQLTLAAVAGEPYVILDRADVLDVDNRAGLILALIRVAEKANVGILVCATTDHVGGSVVDGWTRVAVADGATGA